MKVKKIRKGKLVIATPRILVSPPSLYLLSFSLSSLVSFFYSLRLVPDEIYIKITGLIFVLFGTLLVRWSFQTMKAYNTPASPYESSTSLVVNGPFQYSRNPVYLAMTLLYIGFSLIITSTWSLLLLPVLLLIMHYAVILQEERYLIVEFGQAYQDYIQQVRRWL